MRWAIVGSRDYRNLEAVRMVVRDLDRRGIVIVTGGARGVDQAAAAEARRLGIPVEEYLPDWGTYGRAAGMIRNRQIVANAHAMIAFWDGKSPGTRHVMALARKAGLEVHVYGHDRKGPQKRGRT